MDFLTELKRLLDAEATPLLDPLSELTKAQAGLLEAINKRNSDISMQVEEIYDIVKEADENARELKSAAKREAQLLNALIEITDLLDNSVQFMRSAGAVHAETLAAKREEALTASGLERVGDIGQRLDPGLHTVAFAEHSETPFETVIKVVECGYTYRGKVLRKATVIISKGGNNE